MTHAASVVAVGWVGAEHTIRLGQDVSEDPCMASRTIWCAIASREHETVEKIVELHMV